MNIRLRHKTAKSDRVYKLHTAYLRGGAFEWFEPFVTDYVENTEDDREADTVAIFNSWEAFKERIKMVYGDVDETRTAERQIHRLRQTSSVNKYVVESQLIASRLIRGHALRA